MGFQETFYNFLKKFNKTKIEDKIYDQDKKLLDLGKLLTDEELERTLALVDSGSVFGTSFFQKFFDLAVGRNQRYEEYEQIYYRIPEASAALQMYTDLILSPNVGDRNNELVYLKEPGNLGNRAKIYAEILIKKTKLTEILPNIIFTSCLYGDCFVELNKTRESIKYIIHSPKNVTLITDMVSGIEAGILVYQDNKESAIKKLLSDKFPSLNVEFPKKLVTIVSSENFGVSMSETDEGEISKYIENQIKDLVKDTLSYEQAKFKYIPPSKYSRFPIYYNNFYFPYGTSLFDTIRGVSKQLLLIEAALGVAKISRSPLRYKYLVEVGTTPQDKIRTLLEGVKNRIKKNKVIDFESGYSFDTIPDMLSPEEDIWIPVVNGTRMLDMEPIDTGSTETFTNDAEYFKKKLIGALGIPPAYLAEEQGASTRALLTLEDIRFSRTIKKYQSDLNFGLNDLINKSLIMIKNPELAGQLEISLPKPKNVEDNVRVENIANRLSVASSFISTFPNIPKLWVLKEIVGLSDSDIDDMKDDIETQKDLIIFNEQTVGESSGEGGETPLGDAFNEPGADFGEEIPNGEEGDPFEMSGEPETSSDTDLNLEALESIPEDETNPKKL